MPRRLPRLKFPEPIYASPEETARVVINTKPSQALEYVDKRAALVAHRKAERATFRPGSRVGVKTLEHMSAPPPKIAQIFGLRLWSTAATCRPSRVSIAAF